MIVVQISAAEAISFVQQWHYSNSATAGVARYGWLTSDDCDPGPLGTLLGVSIFDNGNHDTRKGPFGPDHWQHVLHHQRLAVHPDMPHGTTSMFQSAALKALHRDRPTTWAVVTYADVDQGHTGTIYQATNAIYTGLRTKGNLYFRTQEGTIATMQSLKSAGTWPERRAEAARRGWTEVRSKGKHRYVYLLGTPRQKKAYPPLLWESLPYPSTEKAAT